MPFHLFTGVFRTGFTSEGFNRTGIPSAIWNFVEPYAKIDQVSGIAVLAIVIVVLSNLASNVPTEIIEKGLFWFGSKRFASKRFNSKRYWSKRYTLKQFASKRYGSKRFDSKRYGSKRYSSKRFASKRFDSKRYWSKWYGSKRYWSKRLVETVRFETVLVETVRVETVLLETVRVETVRVETVRVETVRVEMVRNSWWQQRLLLYHPKRRKKTWLILAWVSTVAGNLSLLGSAANLIVCEQARRSQNYRYNLTFWNHLKFGVISTIAVTTVGLPLIMFMA
ncbi:hypothetical protein Hanom_Chr13g01188151 [Helianthus anomalus]